MKITSISIFKDRNGFYAHGSYYEALHSVTLRINSQIDEKFWYPTLTFFMDLPDLVAFKNSVLSAYDEVMREAGYGK